MLATQIAGSLSLIQAAFSISDSRYKIRPFDSTKDQVALEEICSTVYGGKDYLPSTAASLEIDPLCTFLCAADSESDRIVAVANSRKIGPRMSWLEAVRTSTDHRGRGLAGILTRSLVDASARDAHDTATCTVASNAAMRAVLERAGLAELQQMHQCRLAALAALPGWGPGDDDGGGAPQPLLRALGAGDAVGGRARALVWESIVTEDGVRAALRRVRQAGGIGHLPGLYELLAQEAADDAVRGGRVWGTADGDGQPAAVFCLTRQEKIGSIRSKWVCSVATADADAFDSALWQACSDRCLSTLGGDVAFTVAFDGAVPIGDGSSAVCRALPLVDDPCLLFSTLAL